MKKTVIFGGTFNPPHIGHRQMLEYLEKRSDIERVLIVPNKAPVHKVGFELASSRDRLNMCKILAEDFPKVSVWDTELTRTTKSYSYYTLLEYKKQFGDDKPWILCGADMLVTLKTWYKYEELIKLCGIFALFRKGENEENYKNAVEELKSDGALVEPLSADIENISSTFIRELFSSNKNTEGTVPEKIEEYIKEHSLYRGNLDMTIEEYKSHIRKRLSDKRYYHSLCVADEAVRLADRYGADKQKAYLAGLLHDVLKDTSSNEQLKFSKQFGIILSDLEISAPSLYHSLIGSEYVRHVLGIEDEEIISAIKYHTTAKADMSLLQKIIYLADYTSLDRDYNGVEDMRQAVNEGLDKAMKVALDYTVQDLEEKHVTAHPDTLAAFKQYSSDNQSSGV